MKREGLKIFKDKTSLNLSWNYATAQGQRANSRPQSSYLVP